ncbi:MAG: hypothetical protein AB1633_07555 [Elusimicrobiota bacterium]
MDIDGKDYLTWLHELRKKKWAEEKKSGLTGVEWLKKITKEAEKILGKEIHKIELILK